MRQILIKIIRILPYHISKRPYDVIQFLVKCIAHSLGLKIWTRNSYYFNNMAPGISDIDFTLFLTSSSNQTQVQKFLHIYSKLKSFFPILGEINVIHSDDILCIGQTINHFELRRDPELLKYIPNSKEQEGERLVYLLRMLESDISHLKMNPSTRKKKWHFHFHEISKAPPDHLSLESLIEYIASITPYGIEQSNTTDFLKYYLNHELKETYSHYRKMKKIKIFIILYPHRWLQVANGINDIEICLSTIAFSEIEIQVIIAQIKWELFGIYSQKYALSKKQNPWNYFSMIEKFLMNIKTSSEGQTVDEVLILIREIRGSFVTLEK